MSGFTPLFQACLVTLAYCDQFHYALTAEEVWQRLPAYLEGETRFAGVEEVSQAEVRRELHFATQLGVVLYAEWQGLSYYFLNPLSHPSIRHERAVLVPEAHKSLTQLQDFLTKLPWVRALGITGSLAMNQVRAEDDVDVCIVTAPGTLWLTRALVSVYSWWSGHWRSWNEDWQGNVRNQRPFRWCLNMWLEQHSKSICWSPSLYIAYELKQVVWVWDRGGVEQWFSDRHPWVKKWLPHWPNHQSRTKDVSTITPLWILPVITICNHILYLVQRLYMWPHITSEQVSLREALFHPRSTSSLVEVGWVRALRQAITRVHLQKRWQSWQRSPVTDHLLQQAHVEMIPITLVTGVFDVLHREHIHFLEKAKSLGGLLLVAVESDERVRAMKGPARPINTLMKRVARLERLQIADAVVALPKVFSRPADYRALLEWCRPAFLAVSSHSPHQDIKAKMMRAVGGVLQVVHEHNPSVSTTLLIEKNRPE